VPTPLERLERACAEVKEASGPDFFRRLRDYVKLTRDEKPIRKALESLKREAEKASEEFASDDRRFVQELNTIRSRLVKLAPEADDSQLVRPRVEGHVAPLASAEGFEWTYTLANFDAIIADTDDKIIVKKDLDSSDSGTLGAILHAKIYDVRYPEQESTSGAIGRSETDQRPDLMAVAAEVNEVEGRQVAAYRKVEDALETTGFIAMTRIENVVAHLEPREALPMKTQEEKNAAVNAMFAEVMGGFNYLREATRPPDIAGPPESEKAREILERHEDECRSALDRVHRPLRQHLEGKRNLPTLVGRIRHVPPLIGFIADVGGFVVVVAFVLRIAGVI